MKNHQNCPETMKNQHKTMKKQENPPGTMKKQAGTMKNHENRPGTMKNMKTDLEPAKTNLEGISKNVTNKQTDRTFLPSRQTIGQSDHFSLRTNRQTDRTFLLYIDFRRGVRLHIAFEDDIQ